MRFFRIPSFTGIEAHRDDADRGSLRVVEGCLPFGSGGLRSGPVWKSVGTVNNVSESDENQLLASDDGNGNSALFVTRLGEVHDMALSTTEHAKVSFFVSTYSVVDPLNLYREQRAVLSPVGNRLFSFGDSDGEAVFIGKGPPAAQASVFPDATLYSYEWSRFPDCKFFVQGPKKTLFASGNPNKPLTVYISEPASKTSPYRDSPYSTELTSENAGNLSTVDILGSNAPEITALSTRGDQVIVHTDKGCHILYAPSSDQAETGYRVEQAPATNFSAAVNPQVVGGESGTMSFWLGHDGQIYKDESASRGAEDKKSQADPDQASWKAKGLWEKEFTHDLRKAFATYDPQSGLYWVFVPSIEYLTEIADSVPSIVTDISLVEEKATTVSDLTLIEPLPTVVSNVKVAAYPPAIVQSLELTEQLPGFVSDIKAGTFPPALVKDLSVITRPLSGPTDLTAEVLAPPVPGQVTNLTISEELPTTVSDISVGGLAPSTVTNISVTEDAPGQVNALSVDVPFDPSVYASDGAFLMSNPGLLESGAIASGALNSSWCQTSFASNCPSTTLAGLQNTSNASAWRMTKYFPDSGSAGKAVASHRYPDVNNGRLVSLCFMGITYEGTRNLDDLNLGDFPMWNGTISGTQHAWKMISNDVNNSLQENWLLYDPTDEEYKIFRGTLLPNGLYGNSFIMDKVDNYDQALDADNPFGSYITNGLNNSQFWVASVGIDADDATATNTVTARIKLSLPKATLDGSSIDGIEVAPYDGNVISTF